MIRTDIMIFQAKGIRRYKPIVQIKLDLFEFETPVSEENLLRAISLTVFKIQVLSNDRQGKWIVKKPRESMAKGAKMGAYMTIKFKNLADMEDFLVALEYSCS